MRACGTREEHIPIWRHFYPNLAESTIMLIPAPLMRYSAASHRQGLCFDVPCPRRSRCKGAHVARLSQAIASFCDLKSFWFLCKLSRAGFNTPLLFSEVSSILCMQPYVFVRRTILRTSSVFLYLLRKFPRLLKLSSLDCADCFLTSAFL